MTEDQREIYRKVFEESKKREQAHEKRRMQEVIKRKQEGKMHAGDYVYFQEKPKDKIAHQDKKIAHPDSMGKIHATVLLILGMIGSLIFNQWYAIWLLLLLWYFGKDKV